MARDFVVKMIRGGRPNSPKDRSEKTLSPLDASGHSKSPFSLKKITTQPEMCGRQTVSYLQPEFDGPPEAMLRKQSSPATFHFGIDTTQPITAQQQQQQQQRSRKFNVNRFAGDQFAPIPEVNSKPPPLPPPRERASKSMGDLYEAMTSTYRAANENATRILSDEDAAPDSGAAGAAQTRQRSTTPRRTLPVIPMKRAPPVLVKVLSKYTMYAHSCRTCRVSVTCSYFSLILITV